MKHCFYLFFLPILLVACQTKEEKAAEFIKNELFKTLDNFDSYTPLETTVTEAKQTLLNDSACWIEVVKLGVFQRLVDEAWKEAQQNKKLMDIWGEPTRYSSYYEDKRYYEYKEKYDDYLNQTEVFEECFEIQADKLRDTLKTLDEDLVIGWEVIHRFRSKDKEGNTSVTNYRYIIDKDFKKILIREDMDESGYKNRRRLLEEVLND